MDKVLILDFGSQYTQLIARRVREINVYCEILPYDVEPKRIEQFNPKAIIFSGGPNRHKGFSPETAKTHRLIFSDGGQGVTIHSFPLSLITVGKQQ